MIYTCKPAKVSIYVNSEKKSTSQIKAETGCTALINGGLFNMSTFKPVCHLKVDGKVLVKDQYKYWGLAWNDKDVVMVNDYSAYKNYICCCALVKDGQPLTLLNSDALGGYRPRTAFGVFPDGRVWLYAETSPGRTPKQLQQIALKAGVKHAIMLDGGGSTQGASPTSTLNAARRVHNYICVWEDVDEEMTEDMTEASLRQKVVKTAVKYLGCKEADGSHKKIIDKYNAHKPLARGYAVKYTDEWCATFVSAVGIELGLTDIMPTECSCSKMIELYKAKGRWKEADSYRPKPGDILMYDWNDSGTGDNVGAPDHVGIVSAINGLELTVIEGNKGEAVAYRDMTVNGKYIRGYCVPDYASAAAETPKTSPTTEGGKTVTVTIPQLEKGDKCTTVKALQQLLTAKGYDTLGADGIFGANTEKALKKYQAAKGLTADGVCGKNTWTALLMK